MAYVAHEEETDFCRIEIIYDEESGNPLKDMDSLGTLIGPRSISSTIWDETFTEWETIEEQLKVENEYDPIAVIVPVQYSDYGSNGARIHAGKPIRIGEPFPEWCNGAMITPRSRVLDEWKAKRITPKIRENVEQCLTGEVETLNLWLSGDVYGYEVTDRETGNYVDSVWGFYSEPDGDVLEEARDAARRYDAAKQDKHALALVAGV